MCRRFQKDQGQSDIALVKLKRLHMFRFMNETDFPVCTPPLCEQVKKMDPVVQKTIGVAHDYGCGFAKMAASDPLSYFVCSRMVSSWTVHHDRDLCVREDVQETINVVSVRRQRLLDQNRFRSCGQSVKKIEFMMVIRCRNIDDIPRFLEPSGTVSWR